jgi:hypothetical protein
MISSYFLSFNLMYVRFNHNLHHKIVISCCLWIVFRPIFSCDLSGLHQMVQLSLISVVVNDTSDDSISV